MKSYQEFFAELKRRNVFKVAGIYGIVSFGIIQAADVMLPRLGLPDWTVTFMVAVVVLAFPVALLLAWAFDLTPEGLRRTDAPEPGEIESIMAAPASQRWPAGLLALEQSGSDVLFQTSEDFPGIEALRIPRASIEGERRTLVCLDLGGGPSRRAGMSWRT